MNTRKNIPRLPVSAAASALARFRARNLLFITTDQQRQDSLPCYGLGHFHADGHWGTCSDRKQDYKSSSS